MPNTFLLENMRCPKCKSEQPFTIDCHCYFEVYDTHITPPKLPVDPEWDRQSYCKCNKCGFEGEVADFNCEEAE